MPNIVTPSLPAHTLFGSTANRPASGVDGLLYFNTDYGIIEQWNGSSWVMISEYASYRELHEDTNGGTIFTHEFDPENMTNCQYRLIGYIWEQSGVANPVDLTVNGVTQANYGLVQLSGVSVTNGGGEVSWRLTTIYQNDMFVFDYLISVVNNVGFIVGNGVQDMTDRGILIRGSLSSAGSVLMTVQLHTTGNARGAVALTRVSRVLIP